MCFLSSLHDRGIIYGVFSIDIQNTFRFDSQLWSNTREFNLPGGKTGLNSQETKLPTYWNTPFSKVCLGMKIGQQIKFIVINTGATSLYSLIADGKYRPTSLRRNAWKKLIGSRASLQVNCNKQGFNAVCTVSRYSRARIGLVANNENDCRTCNSRIGFGTAGNSDTITCGNVATSSADKGDKFIKTMGGIFVK